VVVVPGVTVLLEPVTVPTPGLTVRDDALETLHDSVEGEPRTTLDGVAVKVEMTGAGSLAVPPPQADRRSEASAATVEDLRAWRSSTGAFLSRCPGAAPSA
jgi:hypothetical protein